MFKNIVVKAWSKIYRLEGSPELIPIAFDTSLGSKNSRGLE
jgi:CRISPR-associated endoribonuclease Cas6